MVNAEHIGLGKVLVNAQAQCIGGRTVATERLFNYEARIVGTARFGKLSRHGPEQNRRDRQIVHRLLGVTEFLAQRLERGRIVVVAVHVAQLAQHLDEDFRLRVAAMRLDAFLRALFELVEIPAGLGHTDNRRGQTLVADQPEQGREDLLVGEIARRAEKDQRVRLAFDFSVRHGAFFSR